MTISVASSPFTYLFHGVVVASHYEIPDLERLANDDPAALQPRIRIQEGSQDLLRDLPVAAYDIQVDVNDVYRFLIPEGAVIRYTPGGLAEVATTATMPSDLLGHILIGQLLPNSLADLGYLCLHASCVQVGSTAVAILGDSGMGKSSLAAAFVAAGYPLLGDDCTPLTWDGERVMVHPGPGRLKLWPDTIAALGLEARKRRPIHATDAKWVVDGGSPVTTSMQLTSLLVLACGPDMMLEWVDGRSLIPLLYNNIFGHRRKSRESQASHFTATAKLALDSLVHRLTVPRELNGLPDVVRFLTHVRGPVKK